MYHNTNQEEQTVDQTQLEGAIVEEHEPVRVSVTSWRFVSRKKTVILEGYVKSIHVRSEAISHVTHQGGQLLAVSRNGVVYRLSGPASDCGWEAALAIRKPLFHKQLESARLS